MLHIVDCREIDERPELEACSAQAAAMMGWTTVKKRSTARLERHLLLALLAGAASTGEATGVVVKWQGSLAETATADTAMLMTPWWLGWAVAMVLTLIFVMKMMMESFVIQRRVTTRTVATQSQTTYRVSQAGVGRFTPLVESGCGAWPET